MCGIDTFTSSINVETDATYSPDDIETDATYSPDDLESDILTDGLQSDTLANDIMNIDSTVDEDGDRSMDSASDCVLIKS